MREIKVNILDHRFGGKETGIAVVDIVEKALTFLGERVMVKMEVTGPMVDGPPGMYDFVSDLVRYGIARKVAEEQISSSDAVSEIQSIYRTKGGTGSLSFIVEMSEFCRFMLHRKADAGLVDPVHNLS